jgi:hypothetical protein
MNLPSRRVANPGPPRLLQVLRRVGDREAGSLRQDLDRQRFGDGRELGEQRHGTEVLRCPHDPLTTGNAAVPVTTGNLLFHVIVDDFNRTFSMDGPDGPNGIRLQYEMVRVARTQAKILRDFDVRAESREAALAEMKARFPDYIFLGSWAAAQAK